MNHFSAALVFWFAIMTATKHNGSLGLFIVSWGIVLSWRMTANAIKRTWFKIERLDDSDED